jgi:Flp pilus assembly protein TadG
LSRRRPFLRRFAAAREGVTIVEFALVAAPFLILVLGITDLGFRLYASSMLQGALNEAARQVTVGGVASSSITTFVQGRIQTIFPLGTVTVTSSSYFDYTAAGFGNSDDIVYDKATMTFPEVVPMKLLIGADQATETVKATTMIKNQPYASQPTPPTVCV